MATNLQVMFDNGGGTTVQCDTFAHRYEDPKLAAEDAIKLLNGDTGERWEGNDPDARFEPSDDDIRNGGYVVFAADEIRAQIDSKEIDSSWRNVTEFFAALGCEDVR